MLYDLCCMLYDLMSDHDSTIETHFGYDAEYGCGFRVQPYTNNRHKHFYFIRLGSEEGASSCIDAECAIDNYGCMWRIKTMWHVDSNFRKREWVPYCVWCLDYKYKVINISHVN